MGRSDGEVFGRAPMKLGLTATEEVLIRSAVLLSLLVVAVAVIPILLSMAARFLIGPPVKRQRALAVPMAVLVT